MQILRDAERIRHQRITSETVAASFPYLTLADLRNAGNAERLKIQPPQLSPGDARVLARTQNRTRAAGIRYNEDLNMLFPQVSKVVETQLTRQFRELRSTAEQWLRTWPASSTQYLSPPAPTPNPAPSLHKSPSPSLPKSPSTPSDRKPIPPRNPHK